MKATKIIVFLIIAAVLGGGIYVFQKDKQKKALIAHNKEKFQQVTKAAKKSSSAGLLVMVSAINKYHQIKGHYPKDLIHLYPEFIPDKSFISSLNWKYYPGKGTYLIERNVAGSEVVSSMGPDMKLKTGRKGTSSPVEKIASVDTTKTTKKSTVFADSKTKSGSEKDINKIDGIATVFLPNEIKNPDNITSRDSKKESMLKPEFTIVKKELNNKEKYLLSLKTGNLYIWKTNEGIVGFSDTQYPDERNLTIYKDKSWIEYQFSENSKKNSLY